MFSLDGTFGILLRHTRLLASNFLPPFPRSGFASRPSRSLEPHRYYEGSDSRRPHPGDGSLRLLRLAFPRRVCSPGPPFRPQPRNPSDGRFVSRLSAIGHSRLRLHPASSPRVYAETGSCSYGLAVRLQLLPTPPLGDAVTFGYKVTTHSDRDSHPADKASSRTHWIPGTSPGMTTS